MVEQPICIPRHDYIINVIPKFALRTGVWILKPKAVVSTARSSYITVSKSSMSENSTKK
jgi:hypothetical protein